MAEQKDFIKENIVGRKDSWKKSLKHYIRVVISALIFGALSAACFVVAKPVIERHFPESPAETVTLETSTEETTETIPESSTAAETEPIEQVVQSEMQNYKFSVTDYEKIRTELSKITATAEKSLVEIKKSETAVDFLGEPVMTAASYAGIVVAETGQEVMILVCSDDLQLGDSVDATFGRTSTYTGTVKSKDVKDGLVIVSVQLSTMVARDKEAISQIHFGNSRLLKKGNTLIAIGAPAGVIYSSEYGDVCYVSYNNTYHDEVVENIMTDIDAHTKPGTFIINTSGELVGWITDKLGESSEGYSSIAGCSDFVKWIENMTNGNPIPYLGLDIQEVNAEMQRSGLPQGIYVKNTVEDSPAYAAGMQSGDILVKIDGTDLKTIQEYRTCLQELTPQTEVKVVARRQHGAEYVEVPFTLTVGTR